MYLAHVSKFVTALVAGWIGWAAVVIASAPPGVTAAEWLGLSMATATALGVYGMPNTPQPPPVSSASESSNTSIADSAIAPPPQEHQQGV